MLASDVFHSGANVESLLFGSLLLIGTRDLVLAGAASAAARRRDARCSGRAGSRAASTRRPRAPWACARSCPTPLLLVLVAFAVVASLTAIGALLATALFVVPAATVRLWTQRLRRLAARLGRARGGAGHRRAVALGRAERAARGRRSPCSAARVFALSLRRARLAPPSRGRAALAAAAAAARARPRRLRRERVARAARAPDVVATTTQIGDWARAVGGDAVDVHQILQPNTDPHEYEPRPGDVEAVAGASVVFENGDGLDAWMGKVVSKRRRLARRWSISARRCPCSLPGESERPRGLALRPALVARPAQRRGGRRARSATRSSRADPAHAATYRANAAAYLRAAARARPRHRARASRSVPGGAAQARHRPRRVRLLRAPLRHHGRRRRDPVADDAGAASAGDIAELVRARPARARARRSSPRARSARSWREQIARETGARADYTLYGDTLGPRGSRRRDVPRAWSAANADAMARGFTGGARGCRIAEPR